MFAFIIRRCCWAEASSTTVKNSFYPAHRKICPFSKKWRYLEVTNKALTANVFHLSPNSLRYISMIAWNPIPWVTLEQWNRPPSQQRLGTRVLWLSSPVAQWLSHWASKGSHHIQFRTILWVSSLLGTNTRQVPIPKARLGHFNYFRTRYWPYFWNTSMLATFDC